jgi:predicted small secreted protein
MTISSSRILLLIAAAWSLVATSCNTLRGVGRDVERAGDGIVNSTR